jgi:hypothetical protein
MYAGVVITSVSLPFVDLGKQTGRRKTRKKKLIIPFGADQLELLTEEHTTACSS